MGNKKDKIAWPTDRAMAQVYEKNLWGTDNSSKFYSGTGSHTPEIIDPYIDIITNFLKSFDTPLSVCDLGCGDFNIGKHFVKNSKKYTAIDIVPDLIEYNKEKFKAENLNFVCLDIAKDKLPKADCILIRQVLQHLSNKEIQEIISKLSVYKYIIVTEHIPKGEFVANKNIISGQGIRIKKNSGVDLQKTPFNFKSKRNSELLSIALKENKGRIVTNLFIN